jgi:lipopolysaccharide biosynthesis glycosyltransferase
MDKCLPIAIFIGVDPRERVAANVLIDSLLTHSTTPLAITPLITPQLEQQGLYWRPKDPKQSTSFSFSRFLVPQLLNFQGWGIFMDCDMLCRADISELWALRDENYALMCVKHQHIPTETTKFLGEPQSAYPRKNWSSLMLFNANKCKTLTPQYVNNASGLELHRFHWLADQSEREDSNREDSDQAIGSLPPQWNHLVGVQEPDPSAKILHFTLGGPWFEGQNSFNNTEWFWARDQAMKLYQQP